MSPWKLSNTTFRLAKLNLKSDPILNLQLQVHQDKPGHSDRQYYFVSNKTENICKLVYIKGLFLSSKVQ